MITFWLRKSTFRARSVRWMVPVLSWTSSWSRSMSPNITSPSFFFRRNLHTRLTTLDRENSHRENILEFPGSGLVSPIARVCPSKNQKRAEEETREGSSRTLTVYDLYAHKAAYEWKSSKAHSDESRCHVT